MGNHDSYSDFTEQKMPEWTIEDLDNLEARKWS